MTTPRDTEIATVDPAALRAHVQLKYSEVAVNPDGDFHFHTGRRVAHKLGYDPEILDALPDEAVASFAGVANPFSAAPIPVGSKVLDLGSGGGFDCFYASRLVGPSGRVIGVDMTEAMLDRARAAVDPVGATNVEFREGLLEDLPVEDGWADVVTSNGVLNLVADKSLALREASRVLRSGGVLQFADIAVGRDVPADARCDVDLWTDCIAGAQPVDGWCELIEASGFVDIAVGLAVDVFGGAPGEERARGFEVFGHTFRARKP